MADFFKKTNRDARDKGPTLGKILKAQESIPTPFRAPKKNADSIKLISLPIGNFRTELRSFVSELPDCEQSHWITLFEYADTLSQTSKPSKRRQDRGRTIIEKVDKDVFSRECVRWMNLHKPNPKQPDVSLAVMQGLIILCSTIPNKKLAMAIGSFAEVCFRKVPGYGPRSQKLGNACAHSLNNMALQGHDIAVEQLVRIRSRAIYPNVIKTVNTYLKKIADDRRVSQQELEERCLPTFDFNDDGKLTIAEGQWQADLRLSGLDCHLTWADSDGNEVTKLSKRLKSDHSETIREIEALQKYLKTTLSIQAKALEQGYQTRHTWPFDNWKLTYWQHPVRRSLSERLIWVAEDQEGLISFMIKGREAFDADAKPFKKLGPSSQISLWHPLHEGDDVAKKWESSLVDKWMSQPLSQIGRETFTLVDREFETERYSNRFAAHILHHTQFAALCQKFGWTYRDHNLMSIEKSAAVKSLPKFDLTAEFILTPIADRKTPVPPYAKTDRLLFKSGDQRTIKLEALPPVLLSEVMRELNTMIRISSVADDLTWVDDKTAPED